MNRSSGDPVQIGVIGYGVAARLLHVPAIRSSPRAVLRAVADRSPAQRDMARTLPDVEVFADAADLLDLPGLDAVIIATPPDSHFRLARAALLAGIHVLVEKPMARTVSEAVKLTDLADAHRKVLMVAHEKRFQPVNITVRDLIRNGAIGTPFFCGVHWASNVKLDPAHFIPDEGYRQGYEWRWTGRDIAGGILQDHLTHYVDLIRHWTDREPTDVYAVAMNVASDILGWPEGSSLWDDMSIAMVRFDGGLILRFETGLVGRTMSPLLSIGSGIGEWTEYGYILGSAGQILFDHVPLLSSEYGRVAVWRRDEAVRSHRGWTMVEHPEPDRIEGPPTGAALITLRKHMAEFLSAAAGEPSAGSTARDGTIAVAVTQAAYKSARTARACPVRWAGGSS